MTLKQFILFFTGFLLPVIVFASVDSLPYIVRNYTDEDGLPQNSIKAIAIGKEGFAWLTTEDGLVRFDGHHFENVTRSLSLLSNRFGSIVPGWPGNQFYATTEKEQYISIRDGLVSIDKDFVRLEDEQLDFLPAIKTYRASGSSGLAKNSNGIITHKDSVIIRCDAHLVYIINGSTVSLFQDKRLSYRIGFPHTRQDRFFLVGRQLYYLHDDIRITGFGPSGAVALAVDGKLPAVEAAATAQLKLFWNINDPTGAILYYDHYFYTISPANDHSFHATLISPKFYAEKNEIISAYYDSSRQTLLLGSHINGLFIITRSLFTIRVSEDPLQDKVYYAQLALPDTSLLTAQGHLYKPGSSSPRIMFENSSQRTDKYSLVRDKNGGIWTKKGNILYRSDPTDFHISLQRALPGGINQLYLGLNDLLWIGMVSGELYSMDLRDTSFATKHIGRLPATINCFAQQDKDTLWIGTVSGLYCLQLPANRITTVAGSMNKYIRSIYQGTTDEVWFTTYGQGFYLYQRGQLKAMPLDKNKYLLASHCILRDSKNYFWITTNKGLFQVAHKDLLAYAAGSLPDIYYRYYSTADGLLTNEFNGGCQPCGVQLANGIFSFPSINGLVWLRPEEVRYDKPNEYIFIDKVLIDNSEMKLRENFTVQRNLQQMKILLSVPHWGNPANLHLRYALVRKRQSPTWLPVENNVIVLSTIPSGDYTLLISKTCGFDSSSQSTISLTFNVPGPWILRPGVLAALFLLLCILVYFFIRMRTRMVRHRNILLQKRIGEKTAELQEALNDLAQSQQELLYQTEWQQKMIAVFSHDIKAPMKYLMMTAERITKGLTEENNSSFITASSIVHEHIRRLYHVMDNILQYIRTQMMENTVQEEIVDVHELVEEKVSIYYELAGQLHTSLVNEVPVAFTAISNRTLLSVVLHNLVDNAVKVTERGRITINVQRHGSEVSIIINDTGIGMHPALVEWINQGRQRGPEGYKEMGIGLLMVKDLAALLQIKLKADSIPGDTTITLTWDERFVKTF